MKTNSLPSAFCLILFAAAAISADTMFAPVALVRDISERVPADTYPQMLCKHGDVVYFKANDHVQGFELWRTDGTTQGTFLLKDVTPGMEHSGLEYECYGTTPNGLTYLRIYTPFNGWELWRTDGTIAGTKQFVNPDPDPDMIGGFFVGFMGNRVLFVPRHDPFKHQLWISDGTTAGTQQLKALPGTIDQGTTDGFSYSAPAGERLLFAVHGAGSTTALWISDGTAAGTQLLTDLPWGLNGYSFAQVGPYALFRSINPDQWGDDLWRTDGTTNGTVQLTPSPPPGISHVIEMSPTVLGQVAVFTQRVIDSGVERKSLWRTDGTPGGTRMIPGPDGDLTPAAIWRWHRLGNRVLFVGETATEGRELWSTDGTDAGTQLLMDIAPGTAASNPEPLSGPQEGDYEVFMANSPDTGNEPWVTDGTPAGTRLVADLRTLSNSTPAAWFTSDASQGFLLVKGAQSFGYTSNSYQLYRYDHPSNQLTSIREFRADSAVLGQIAGGRALMLTDEADHDREIWASDGTPGGTLQLPEIAKPATNLGSEPQFIGVVNGVALLRAINDAEHNVTYALWRADAQGAEKFFEVQPMGAGVPLSGNRLLFAGYYQAYGIEPWVTDGSTQVNLVKDINPEQAFSIRQTCRDARLVAWNGMAYFPAADTDGGEELWRSDGTESGTTRVADIEDGTGDSSPCDLAVFNGALYFAAAQNGDRELWRSDGTTAGTRRVADIRDGASSNPAHLAVFNNALYFVATGSSNRQELWRSDGTEDGTVRVAEVSADPAYAQAIDGLKTAGEHLFFTACSDGTMPSCHLWSSDGTTSGTVMLAESDAVIRLGQRSIGVSGQQLLFVGTDGSTGRELWISDGTPAGTRLLADINPAGDSDPADFTDFNGIPYFRADSGNGFTQLWRTDGTADGTVRVNEISLGDTPNMAGLGRWSATALGHHLLFAADDGEHGLEPWSIENLAPTAAADSATVNSAATTTIDVVNNDSDPDGSIDPATVSIVTQPNSGTATVDTTTGSISYRSNSGYSGSDQFTYRVSDNQGRASGSATVSVTVNAAPTGSSGGGGSSSGGGSWGVFEMLWSLTLAILWRRRLKRRTTSAATNAMRNQQSRLLRGT